MIRQFSGSLQAVVRQLLGSHQAVIRQSSGSCWAVIRQSSGSCQVVVSQVSSSCQAIISQSSGSHQTVIKQSPGSHQAVVNQWPNCKICHLLHSLWIWKPFQFFFWSYMIKTKDLFNILTKINQFSRAKIRFFGQNHTEMPTVLCLVFEQMVGSWWLEAG